MQEPKRLKPFMQVCYTEAKQALRCSERLGLSIGILAVAAVLIPEEWGPVAWCGGVVAFLLLAAQQYQGYRFRELNSRAEHIRRQYLLCDGLGCRLSEANLAPLERRFGKLEADDDPYYTSHLKPGPKRLWMLVWESAFWSEDLQEHLASTFWRKAAGVSTLVLVALLFGLYGPEGPLVSKAVPPALALFVGLNFWGKWWESKQVQAACERTSADCRARVESGASSATDEDELREVMQVVLSYSATMLMAYPPSDEVYEKRKDILNKGWNDIVVGLAGSEWGEQPRS